MVNSDSILSSLDVNWGDAEACVKSLRTFSKIKQNLDLTFLGAPSEEFFVSPMTLRGVLLGAQQGRHFYHHELRAIQELEPHLLPEIPVGPLAEWSFGSLAQPKYFSFYQDAPCPAYNPNHRTKWRAHEMMHGAASFFWDPKITRFSFYVSSRLNEILPVVHWYHFDEIDRPRCPDHLYHVPREFCQECDRAIPYWEIDNQRSDAVDIARQGFAHFDMEMESCKKEMETRRVHETFFEDLNSSKDAIGYLRCHWNRITSWSFGHWMELFSVPGVDYFNDIDVYYNHIVQSSRDLFNADIPWEVDRIKRLQKRKRIQDLAYRYLVGMEVLSDNDFESKYDRSKNWLDEATSTATLLLEKDVNSDHLVEELKKIESDETIFQVGFDLSNASILNLETGLQSAGIEGVDLENFVKGPGFVERGPLPLRYRKFIGEEADEELKLIAMMSHFPRTDLRLERFGMLPESNAQLREGSLEFNSTLRPTEDGHIGFYYNGEFRILEYNISDLKAIGKAMDNDEDIDVEGYDGALFWEALNHGLIGWYP